MTQDQVPVVEPEQSNLVNENTDNNYDDLIEFTDFIDIDNLSFSTSPQQLLSTRSPRASLPPSPIKKPEFIVITTDDDVSPSPEPVKAQPEVPQVPQFSIPTSSAVPPPPQQHQHQQPQQQLNVVTNSETIQKPELSIVTPPVSQETRDDEIVHDEKVIISLSSSPEEITKEQFQQQQQEQQTTAQGKRDSYYSNSPLTPNLVQINENRYPQSPESITSPVEKQSPILEKALEHNRPIVDSNGKDIFTNRPISMSFNGLKGPIFGGKLAPHDLRVSESHQSFSISFDDDSSNSGGVGGGFGTDSTDEEEGDDFSNLENDGINANDIGSEYHREINKENNVQLNSQPKSLPNIPKISKRFGTESNKDNYYAPSNFQPPPKAFSHNKIPSISDSSSVNSSPRSLGSIISRKWGKKPSQSQNNSPLQYQSPRFMTKTNGVRFSSRIILYDTYNGEEYDRHPDTATCNQLTPLLAQQIKEELNAFKSSMDIHIESRENTHFF
ncbi:hypothetical protein DFJ63DRAFT_319010 [Scheffersomyces coipomensis]|uniref:uncharacterized protein n=1 Tax=Scheffersomyces coipomensis TaxID=1788519 RepID=UPI00315DC14E